jgi:NurA-like 5'-3' nuclease
VHTRFITGDDRPGGLVQVLVEVEAVGGMACGVDGFRPNESESSTHQALFLPLQSMYGSSSQQCHFVEACMERRVHA